MYGEKMSTFTVYKFTKSSNGVLYKYLYFLNSTGIEIATVFLTRRYQFVFLVDEYS